MGTIHRAYDRLAGRDVAYKRLRVSDEADRPRLSALFQREYDTLARLAHPNIVAAYDYGFDDGGPYYAMELLAGDDLTKLAPLPWRESARLLRDIASALALVHARKLLHRDVGPNNVRISADGHAKLLDFGALTSFGTPTEVVGTPGFMAPECLTTEALDQRTDLYSLGALAYWMLTRRLAVRAHSIDDLPEAWDHSIAPPSTVLLRTQESGGSLPETDLPRAFDELVLSLLQRDRDGRPRSASDVIERLATLAELGPEQHETRVASSYLQHTPLCGRASAVAALRTTLSEVVQGHGATLVIDAAGGAGRTAMLEQLAIEAELSGAAVLRAEGKVHTGPLGLIRHLVHTGVATSPELAPLRNDITRSSLPPALAPDTRKQSPLETAERHARVMASMQAALLQMAMQAPLVLLIDDADSADAQSLGLLAALSQVLSRHRILLAVSRLAGPASSDAMTVLVSGARVFSLAPLSRADVGELAGHIFGDVPNVSRIAGWLHDESGGSPASCISLVRTLLARGDVRYARGTFIVPTELEPGLLQESANELVVEGLNQLPPAALDVAQLLSLSDGALSIEQLSRATGRSSPETFVSVAPLLERKLLLESGGQLAFASSALRVALTDSIESHEACVLHLALARMRAAEPEGTLLDRYAAGLHYIRAGATYELEGARLIGETARGRNYEVALSAASVRYLEAALRVYRGQHVPDRELLDLLVPLCVAGFYGDIDAQRRHLDPTMRALYAATGLDLATRLKRVLGTRLALIVGLLCAMVWRRLRPPRLHRRKVLENVESLINVASTATASAASIMEQSEAARSAAWLAPFSATSPHSAMQVARQFCLAVSELPAGRASSASARLEQVMSALAMPVRGMDERVREQMLSGCLNGLAQANIEARPESALASADKLARRGAFFAPHAELARMLYHGFRGAIVETERHRARTEELALRGGISWSALVLLTMRDHQLSLLTRNVNTLVRAASELSRSARLGPWLTALHALAEADLLVFRGQSAEAVVAYERLLETDGVPSNTFSVLSYGMYARALCETGRASRAVALCETTLARFDREREPQAMYGRQLLEQQLALAQAELGMFDASCTSLDALLARAEQENDDNPLRLGGLHRDRALVSALMGDAPRFEQSFAEMRRWFARTKNPWLLQQCDALLLRAESAGVRPSTLRAGRPELDGDADDLDGSTFVGSDRGGAPDSATRTQRR